MSEIKRIVGSGPTETEKEFVRSGRCFLGPKAQDKIAAIVARERRTGNQVTKFDVIGHLIDKGLPSVMQNLDTIKFCIDDEDANTLYYVLLDTHQRMHDVCKSSDLKMLELAPMAINQALEEMGKI